MSEFAEPVAEDQAFVLQPLYPDPQVPRWGERPPSRVESTFALFSPALC